MADSGIIKMGNVRQVGIAIRDSASLVEVLSSTFGFSDWLIIPAEAPMLRATLEDKNYTLPVGPTDFEFVQR